MSSDPAATFHALCEQVAMLEARTVHLAEQQQALIDAVAANKRDLDRASQELIAQIETDDRLLAARHLPRVTPWFHDIVTGLHPFITGVVEHSVTLPDGTPGTRPFPTLTVPHALNEHEVEELSVALDAYASRFATDPCVLPGWDDGLTISKASDPDQADTWTIAYNADCTHAVLRRTHPGGAHDPDRSGSLSDTILWLSDDLFGRSTPPTDSPTSSGSWTFRQKWMGGERVASPTTRPRPVL